MFIVFGVQCCFNSSSGGFIVDFGCFDRFSRSLSDFCGRCNLL